MWRLPVALTRFFSPEDRAVLDAVFATLLPGDPSAHIPGAAEAGASELVARLLTLDESTYFEIPEWRRLYGAGIPALSRAATARYGKPFGALADDERIQILEALSRAALGGFPERFAQKKFFALLRSHCIEGCFADPRWGGNQNGVMWRYIGYLADPESGGGSR